MAEDTLQQHSASFHASLNRPILMMGGDRELMYAVLGISLIIPVAFIHISFWLGVVLGMILWGVGAYFLRKVALADQQMRHVYKRSLKFGKYFPAQAHYTAPVPDIAGKK